MKHILLILIVLKTATAFSVGSNSSPAGRLGGAPFCPLTDGNAVYQARTLLQIIKQQFIQFVDSCDNVKPNGARIERTDADGNTMVVELSENFILFPNPNNGNMQLLYNINQSKTATLIIYDITGKQVFVKALDISTNLADISIDNLSQGVYYYKITDANSKVLKSDKLIIIK